MIVTVNPYIFMHKAPTSILNVAGKAKSVNGAVKIVVFEPVSEIYTCHDFTGSECDLVLLSMC